MGLRQVLKDSIDSVMADQWKEFFYCDTLPNDVLMRQGQKQTGKRSANTKGSDNIISNGSRIAVADGQCMMIVEQGRVVEFCAQPGEFIYDTSTEPSLFAGKLGRSILDTFKTVGKRFSFGGDTGKVQKVYYFNTKEILGNKFGTPNPILFEVVNKRIGISRTVQVRCNGIYSYVISDPLLFYSRLCGNVVYEFTRDQIDDQLKSEFIDALQPAFGALAAMELRPAQIPGKVNELKAAMNQALQADWIEKRGISVGKIALNPITLTSEDMKTINELEDLANLGTNPFMMAGKMTNATADAMKTAAGNSAGAMTGFLGMGMVGMAGQGGQAGFGAAQNLYQMGSQQRQSQAAAGEGGWTCACGAISTGKFCPECGTPRPDSQGWVCSCGAVNKGKFCQECGARKPTGAPLYRCDKCGWEPEDPHHPPRFCPECGDPFDDGDVR